MLKHIPMFNRVKNNSIIILSVNIKRKRNERFKNKKLKHKTIIKLIK